MVMECYNYGCPNSLPPWLHSCQGQLGHGAAVQIALLQSEQSQGHQLGQVVVEASDPGPMHLMLAGQDPFK